MPVTRSQTTRLHSRHALGMGPQNPDYYILGGWETLKKAHTRRARPIKADERDNLRDFDVELEAYKNAVRKLKSSPHATLRMLEFDLDVPTDERIERACELAGVDPGVFQTKRCVTRDNKMVSFCFPCLWEGDDQPIRSFSLNDTRHPLCDTHCHVIGNLLGVNPLCLIRSLPCKYPNCDRVFTGERLDKLRAHYKKRHRDEQQEEVSPTCSPRHSPTLFTSSLPSAASLEAHSPASLTLPQPISSSPPQVRDITIVEYQTEHTTPPASESFITPWVTGHFARRVELYTPNSMHWAPLAYASRDGHETLVPDYSDNFDAHIPLIEVSIPCHEISFEEMTWLTEDRSQQEVQDEEERLALRFGLAGERELGPLVLDHIYQPLDIW